MELKNFDGERAFDLRNAGDGQIVEVRAKRGEGRVVVQIEKKWDKDASVSCVRVRS